MMNENFNKTEFIKNIKESIKTIFSKKIENCNDHEKLHGLSKTIMNYISDDWNLTKKKYNDNKQAIYLSAEYLVGRAFGNNLINLGLYDNVKEALLELGININHIEEVEEDAGLGNGGLGRLAACFLDSAATEDMPLIGYGLRYDFGIFKQSFKDGFQIEEVDNWQQYGDPWSIRRNDESVLVKFRNETIKAVPYDTPIIGYDTKNINTLRLWKAEPIESFDYKLFNEQKYDESVLLKNSAENISRILYPNDSKDIGKILRLKQQYFFVSASLQDIIKKYKTGKNYEESFKNFSDYYVVQLNDTHPAVAIPELMRLLIDCEGLSFEYAFQIINKTFAYTNHTILSEALEQWSVEFYKNLLPRIYEIIEKINENFIKMLKLKNYTDKMINSMKIIENKKIKMAWLSIHCCFAVNGVAHLHTELLKQGELKDWYHLYPTKFQNKTNGITQRRWLVLCNKELTKFITELLESDQWIKDLRRIDELKKFSNDKKVLEKFIEIKLIKKKQLADYIYKHEGIKIDPNSLYDIQVKRLHEYKRQLLNAFHILDLYYRIKKDPSIDIVKRTFIFGAKSAPGYKRAKSIIKFINDIGKLVNNDSDVDGRIKVVFVKNYSVSYGEKIFPAADLSEQISTAGKEASGTGNMKFMLNGTPTIGTLDGANIEIVEEAGKENNFIFGLTVDDIKRIEAKYNPINSYENVDGLKNVVDALINITFDYSGDCDMLELYMSLLKGTDWHLPDNYYVLKDFEAYRDTQNKVDLAFRDKLNWAKICWLNMCSASKFSSDRTILEYAENIWKINRNKI